MATILDIVERYADDAAFLWNQRAAAVAAPNHDLRSLVDLDERLEACVDGLRHAGAPGWEICVSQLSGGGGGEMFVATVLAVERADLSGIALVLDTGGADAKCARGIVSALGWVDFDHVENILPGLLEVGGSETLQWLGIAACAAHRVDPGPVLTDALSSNNEKLAARAARAAGELGRVDLVPVLQQLLHTSVPDTVRFSAIWSLVLFGNRHLAPRLLEFAKKGEPVAEAAVLLGLRAADLDMATRWVHDHATHSAMTRLATLGAGATGDPSLVPWLCACMGVPELARIAGASFSMLTGIDLDREKLTTKPTPGIDNGPNDDPDDEQVELDPDAWLPWPSLELVAARWHQIAHRFPVGIRQFLGQPTSQEAWLQRALREGTQPQRHASAVELALRARGRPLFEVRAPSARQIAMLGISP